MPFVYSKRNKPLNSVDAGSVNDQIIPQSEAISGLLATERLQQTRDYKCQHRLLDALLRGRRLTWRIVEILPLSMRSCVDSCSHHMTQREPLRRQLTRRARPCAHSNLRRCCFVTFFASAMCTPLGTVDDPTLNKFYAASFKEAAKEKGGNMASVNADMRELLKPAVGADATSAPLTRSSLRAVHLLRKGIIAMKTSERPVIRLEFLIHLGFVTIDAFHVVWSAQGP
jgi:hypothetical protein